MSEQKRKAEEPEVQGPQVTTGTGPGGRGPPLFTGEKANLEHPRGTLWRWMLSYLRPFAWQYVFYMALLIVATIGTAYTPILGKDLIDQGIIGTYDPLTHTFKSNTTIILQFSFFYMVLVLFNALAGYISQYGMGKIGQVVVYSVRNNIINKLQQMSMSFFDRKSSGDIISITTNDVDQLNLLVSGQLVQIFTSAAGLGITVVFMFILNPFLALLSLVIFPIFFGALKIFTHIVSGLFKRTRETISKVTSTIQENITGAKVVQAYGQQEKTAKEFDEANEENFRASYRVRRVFATFFPLMQFITQFLTAAILFAGGFAVVNNFSFLGIAVTVGTLTSFISYLAQLFQPVLMLAQVQNVIESSLAGADRIYGFLQEEAEVRDPEHPVPFGDVRGVIDFEDVSFGYRIATAESATSVKPTVPGDGKKMAQSRGIPDGGKHWIQKPGTKKPDGGTPPLNLQAIKQMVNSLERMLAQQAAIPSASAGGGEGGGMMGGMGGSKGVKQITRALASMRIPEAMLADFPEPVQKAIVEEKILIDKEQNVGLVLEHINVHVDAGNTLAIVGVTGAGKTTMIKLIARFYDVNKGAIKIDGVNVRDVKKTGLRANIGIVPQDSFLFTGTIRENLLYGIHAITPEIEAKAIEISKFLGLHNFIEALPDKYETMLTENASNISIGQRQLMAFARALLADPKILILDEATSSVDPYTETFIQDALDRAREGRTTIIIAHRLSTIKNANYIIVISKDTKGIVEEGTHDDLVTIPGGKYRRLLEMQQL